MSGRLKFNAAMIAALTVAVVLASWVIHGILQRDARQHVLQRANLLMAAAEATRSYTTKFIKPHLDQRLDVEFLPQTVPAFAATETVLSLRKQFPEYTYKEATLNPTNPRDRTTDWEADIVNIFRADATKTELVGERKPWDIKHDINLIFTRRDVPFWTAVRDDPRPETFRSDLWGLIHYSYIGRAHGIPEGFLRIGNWVAGGVQGA